MVISILRSGPLERSDNRDGAKIGRMENLGCGGFPPEKFSNRAPFRNKEIFEEMLKRNCISRKTRSLLQIFGCLSNKQVNYFERRKGKSLFLCHNKQTPNQC